MPGNDAPTSVLRVRGDERAEMALRLRAEGLTFREIGAELGFGATAAHNAVRRALERKQADIAERAGELRVIESAKLDAAAQALWPAVAAGEERAQEVWLRNRSRFAALNGLDLKPEQQVVQPAIVINTALPAEVMAETVDEDGPGELED